VPYSDGFKSRMIQRMTGPRAKSASALSHEVRVPQPTLSTWLREARRLVRMGRHQEADATPPAPRSPKSWSAEEKYRVVIEAAAIPESELGEFLRTKGLHAAQLEEWRRLMKAALAPGGGKGGRLAEKSDKKRVRDLERELHRKDKALAEAAALLVLKKKLAMYLGDEDESTPTRSAT
jgi:transposase